MVTSIMAFPWAVDTFCQQLLDLRETGQNRMKSGQALAISSMSLSQGLSVGMCRSSAHSPHRVCPVGVVGLLPQTALQVKVLRVVGGFCPGVADIALCIQSLGGLHGVLRSHACERQETQLARKMGRAVCLPTGLGILAPPKIATTSWRVRA